MESTSAGACAPGCSSSAVQAQCSCLRLRGLPFFATTQDLAEFFAGYSVLDVLITRSEGKPNGQAFVLLPKTEALKAQVELNNKYMGKRFIEVFSSTVADMETARRMCAEQQKAASIANNGSTSNGSSNHNNHNSSSNNNSHSSQLHQPQQQQPKPAAKAQSNLHIIRLRGLPFSATPADIKAFLAPIELPDGINSIQMARHPDLRPTGEAYVHLSSEPEVMQALNKHKQMMGKRYIEVFPSCLAELQQCMAPPKPTYYQQDQGFAGGSMAMGTDVIHVPMLGAHSIPTSNPAAQAAWLQQQQQLLRQQHHLQLQAAAQQKMLMQQQQQQRQAPSLRMHAQLQAQAQALPNMFGQMQLSDVGSSGQHAQQEALAAAAAAVAAGRAGAQQQQQQSQQHQQQHMLVYNSLSSPMLSGNMLLASPAAGGAGMSGNALLMDKDGGSSYSGYNNATSNASLLASMQACGLTQTAAATATATCSPSPLDVQYYPFFCAGTGAAPMSALMLQEAHSLQPSSLQMMSPSCPTVLNNLKSTAGNVIVPTSAFGAQELFSSSNANALDSPAMAARGLAAAAAGPTAFCSDTLLQGLGSGSIAAVSQGLYTRQQQQQQGAMGRADVTCVPQEWLT